MLWRKLLELVSLAGAFRWAAEISPSLCLCTCAILTLFTVLFQKHPLWQKKQNRKITPQRKNPAAHPRRWCWVPLCPWWEMPLSFPMVFSQDILICSFHPAPGAGCTSGHLDLCPQTPAPAGCFVSVALLPDLSCFLPRGCGRRKSWCVGFPLAVPQLRSWAGDSAVGQCL